MRIDTFDRLEKAIAYTFHDRKWLREALTHSSCAYEANQRGETDTGSNERLEFFGDAILHFVVSELIVKTHPDMAEGAMTKLRASLVCEKTLARVSRKLGLAPLIRTGRSLSRQPGSFRDSLSADALEALIAAIYMDGGLPEAREFITRQFGEQVRAGEILVRDFKSRLQEILQKSGSREVYEQTACMGPEHGRRFTVTLRIDGAAVSEGSATSIKEAEQEAARRYFEALSEGSGGEGSGCI